MSGATVAQSPMILGVIQNDFISKLGGAFGLVGGYASDIFYFIAVIEIVLFALVWAMKGEEGWTAFVFKIFKLAFIFFVITNYPRLLQALIDGFTHTAFTLAGSKASDTFFNPANIWQYGFDAGMQMTKLAVQYGTLNLGMSNLYMVLGFGTLILFALIGAQIILMVAGFYVVSLLALLVLPFGALFGAKNFFDRAIESVFRMGARIFALIMVLGVAVSVWSQFDLSTISNTTVLTKPLGFFFATLVFAILCWRLPSLAVDAIGKVGGSLFESNGSPNISVSTPAGASVTSSAASQVAAGSQLTAATLTTSGAGAAGSGSVSSAASVQASVSGGGSAAGAQVSVGGGAASGASPTAQGNNKSTKRGAEVGISRETLGKLKSTFKQAMRENKPKG